MMHGDFVYNLELELRFKVIRSHKTRIGLKPIKFELIWVDLDGFGKGSSRWTH